MMGLVELLLRAGSIHKSSYPKNIDSRIKLDRRKSKTNFNDSALTFRGVISFAANISR